MAEKKLTPKQARFVEAYTGNATEAARLAGFKGDDATLAVQGGRLLRNAQVVTALKLRETKRTAPLIATREDRQRFWTEVMQDTAVDMNHRLRAAELLGKSNADFIDRHELTGKDGEALSIVIDLGAAKWGGE